MAMETVHPNKIEKASGPGPLNFRRNSTEKTDSGDNKEKVLSRYLRESIGSCHDFCKYGIKEAFDVKESSLISKRLKRKSFGGQNIQETGTDNSTVAKFRMSFAFKSQLSKGLSVNQKGTSNRSTNWQNQLESVVHKNQNATKLTSGASEGLRVKRETVIKSTLRPVSTSRSMKKSAQQLRAPLSPRSPLKGVASISTRDRTVRCASYLKNQQNLKQCAYGDQNNDEAEEKTLYVIKIDNGNEPDKSPSAEYSTAFYESVSLQEDQEESKFAMNGPDDITCVANNASEDAYNRKTANKRSMGKLGKDGSNSCDDKDSQSLKLRFTGCKAIDLHSDNNSPRKLIFRSGTILGQNTSLEVDARRSIPKRDSGVDGDAVRTAIIPEEVALKHQDVEGKKENEVLLDNVIEKTVSELVKSQNSRVKALVGAFETLISLQGNKIYHQHCQPRLRHGLFSSSW